MRLVAFQATSARVRVSSNHWPAWRLTGSRAIWMFVPTETESAAPRGRDGRRVDRATRGRAGLDRDRFVAHRFESVGQTCGISTLQCRSSLRSKGGPQALLALCISDWERAMTAPLPLPLH